jgi:hypothetical protein
MSFNFADAEPVKSSAPGRTKEANPFTEIIAAIALKTKDKNGAQVPVAQAFSMDIPTDEAESKKATDKVKRQLSEAGQANTPKVSTRTDVQPVKDAKGKVVPGKVTVTFWTIPPITRTRTAAAPTTDAPTV